MNHLLRALLWALLALFLGCLALVAEAQEGPRPSRRSQEPQNSLPDAPRAIYDPAAAIL